MEYNNRIIVAVKRRPSWLNYVLAGAAVAVIAAVAVYVRSEIGTFLSRRK